MNRRRFLAAVMFAGLSPIALAHTPYRQWKVFRQRYLLITTSRTDLAGDALGDRFAEVLLAEIPQSRAMVSRAINLERIASLITTNQANIAVLDHASAGALMRGEAPFVDYGAFPLQVIVQTESHYLVCREDVPLHHGYMIAGALMDHAADLGIGIPGDGAMPVHPGAAAFARGETIEAPQ
jgi:hypothetical protein